MDEFIYFDEKKKCLRLNAEGERQLSKYRVEHQIAKRKIELVGLDEICVESEIAWLCEWKKGRVIGIVVWLAIAVLIYGITFYHIIMNQNSAGGFRVTNADTFLFAMSGFSALLGMVLFTIVGIVVITICIKNLLEVGNSLWIRKLTKASKMKNYYNEMERCMKRLESLRKEIEELNAQKEALEQKMAILEAHEERYF